MIKVVSNTSPIIFLSKIEALDLLPQCFDQVMIPPSVSNELGDLLPPNYIKHIPISTAGQYFVRGALDMRRSLHVGELEAMTNGVGLKWSVITNPTRLQDVVPIFRSHLLKSFPNLLQKLF